MNDAVKQWDELRAVREQIKEMDRLRDHGSTYQVSFTLYEQSQDITIKVEHDLLRTLLQAREKWLVERLREQRAAILRLADELGDLETS